MDMAGRYHDFYFFLQDVFGDEWSTRDPRDISDATTAYIRDTPNVTLIVDPGNLPDNIVSSVWNSMGNIEWRGDEDEYIQVVRQHVLTLGKFGVVDGFCGGRVDTVTPFDPSQNSGLGYRPGCIPRVLSDMVCVGGYSVVNTLAPAFGAEGVVYSHAVDIWVEKHVEGRRSSTGKLRHADIEEFEATEADRRS